MKLDFSVILLLILSVLALTVVLFRSLNWSFNPDAAKQREFLAKYENYRMNLDLLYDLRRAYMHEIHNTLIANENTSRKKFLKTSLAIYQDANRTISDEEEFAAREAKAAEIKTRQISQRGMILRYDQNLDGIVLLPEVKLYLLQLNTHPQRGRPRDVVEKSAEEFMQQYDLNGDDIIFPEEMLALHPSQYFYIYPGKYGAKKELGEALGEEFSAYDQDRFLQLAGKAFNYIDSDNNKNLTREEISKYEYKARQIRDTVNKYREALNIQQEPHYRDNIIADEALKKARRIERELSLFIKIFQVLPGDMKDAYNKLPDCTAYNCGQGNEDGRIGGSEFKKFDRLKDERYLFWTHLQKVSLLPGLAKDGAIAINPILALVTHDGYDHTSQEHYQIYDYDGKNPLPFAYEGAETPKGLYLMITGDVDGDFVLDTKHDQVYYGLHPLTPYQAGEIDKKADDGNPLTGKIIAAGGNHCLKNFWFGTVNYRDSDEYCVSLYWRLQ